MIRLVTLPLGALAGALTIGVLSPRLWRHGSDSCSDNVIPGLVLGFVVFGIGHVLAEVAVVIARFWSLPARFEILVGVLIMGGLATGFAAAEPEPTANVALALAALIAWTIVFAAERVSVARGASTIRPRASLPRAKQTE